MTKREIKRLAQLMTYAVIYQQGADWDDGVLEASKEYAEKRMRAIKFPDGWQRLGTYDLLKEWLLKQKTKG